MKTSKKKRSTKTMTSDVDVQVDPRTYVMNEYNNVVLHGTVGFTTFGFVRQLPNFLTGSTHYCGYLVLEADCPFALKQSSLNPMSYLDCPVHGGLTWFEKSVVNKKFVVAGFDTAHYSSGVWSEDRMMEEMNRFAAWVEDYNSSRSQK
jgi:hypothetical protein